MVPGMWNLTRLTGIGWIQFHIHVVLNIIVLVVAIKNTIAWKM